MKTVHQLVVLFGSLACCIQGQSAPTNALSGVTNITVYATNLLAFTNTPPPIGSSLVPRIVERGAHYNVYERVLPNPIASAGIGVLRVSRYTELGNGLNYFKDGQWHESHEQFAIALNGGAVATQTLHQVTLAPNLNTAGSFNLLGPDGVRLRGNVLALGLYDATSGQVALFATITNSIGQLKLPARDTVIYPNAFSGILADVVYVNRKSGLSQWVVLHQSPPSPASYGMNPETTRLEVFTEFMDAPVPQVTGHILESETDPNKRAAMVSPDWIDDFLDFGELKFIQGRAFATVPESLVGSALLPGHGVRVGKSLVQVNGRTILVESVKWTDAQSLFASVSSQSKWFAATAATASPASAFPRSTLAAHLPVVPARLAQTRPETIQLASASPSQPGVVLDWESMTGGNNVTLRSGTTYLLNRGATLFGTTTIQDAVVKYAKGASLSLSQGVTNSVVVCQTGPYSNAVFTAMLDNSVGDVVEPGSPDGNYASTALYLLGDNTQLNHIRIAFADEAIRYYGGYDGLEVRNAQIVHCGKAIVGDGGNFFHPQGVVLRNVLMQAVQAGFSAYDNFAAYGEHLTVDGCATLIQRSQFIFGTVSLNVKNSILANLTSPGAQVTVSGSYNGFFNSPTFGSASTQYQETGSGSPFQPAGAGLHYLMPGSNFRQKGTTSIDATLKSDLKAATTQAPDIVTAPTSETTLQPHIQRDPGTTAFDLGYHYDPLDAVVGSVEIRNAKLTIAPGTRLATYGVNGFMLGAGGVLESTGSPLNPVRFLRCYTVQEQPFTTDAVEWSTIGVLADSANPQATLRFTDFRTSSVNTFHLSAGSSGTFAFMDCQFHGGSLRVQNLSSGTPGIRLGLTNNLFERVATEVDSSSDPTTASVRNCLFKDGALTLNQSGSDVWNFTDNVFDATTITQSGAIAHGYNAYRNVVNPLAPGVASDMTLTSLTYASGTLGSYYLGSSSPTLVDAGSQSAGLAGLYTYTTSTSQSRELNSQVDIGLHYVALNAGQPWDSNGNGVADYLETDLDGDGMADAWEFQHFGNLDQSWDGNYDGDNDNNLDEYLAGTDPNNIVFSVSFPNDHVNTISADGTIAFTKGHPASMAVLVNSTSFDSATWTPYNSSFTATLGPDGKYDVWVGLRGLSEKSDQAWQRWQITVDTGPPVIVITNPVVNVTARPMIQLQGFSREPLSSVRFDLSNDAGTVTGEQGFVVQEYYDKSSHEFTTNWFQCFDIELTNGLNTITLHATDLAGNTTDLQYPITMDLTTAVLPPTVTLMYPLDGYEICGDSFTLEAVVDDPTATAIAQIVSSDAVTNYVNGLIERNGKLWVEGLPLAVGDNSVTLTVTSAANKTTTQTLTVTKSDAVLTMDPVSESDLRKMKLTVSGTINVSNHTVRVNGIEATVSGSTWTAVDVPMNRGGTATFDIVATPNP